MMPTLSPIQEAVMQDIVAWYKKPANTPNNREFYLYGYAGTGKSTIVETAIDELKAHCGVKKVVTAAYTGKAASVLHKKGVPNAMTIHRLLYIPTKDEVGRLIFVKRDTTEGDFADLIVLDECSMIGDEIANDIRALGKKILIIGDPGQLPPIGGTAGFHTDKPNALLTEIHRQAGDSPIIRLATMVRNGEKLPLNFEEGLVRIMPLNWQNREPIFNLDTQVIAGTHRTRYNYTREIRKNLGIPGELPVAGEKIICCKTNYRKGIFNGFTGFAGEMELDPVEVVGKDGKPYTVNDWYLDTHLDDMDQALLNVKIDPYLFMNHYHNGTLKPMPENEDSYGQYSEFDFGYVITCHKAQGSSWKDVTVIDDSDAFKENKARWLYTAITRAEEGLTILSRQYK